MSKITLNNVGSLIDATSAATTINSNSATIQTAFDNTLSRDGTGPNTMGTALDMNSKQIFNLPTPATANSPLRLQDLETFNGGGTISSLPTGGTTGQFLSKNSNTNFDAGWGNGVSSVALALPTDFVISGSPVTSAGTLTGSWQTTPTGSGAVVRTSAPTISTPTITGHPNIEGVTSTGATGTGKFVFDTAPTIGAATIGSVNGNTITAGTGTLTLGSGTLNSGTGATLTGSTVSAIFYDNIPQNSQSAAYAIVAGDAQKHVFHPTGDNNARTFTIPANASVAFPVGTVISFVNMINTVTIAITTDTLILAGTGATGSRTLAANGMATAIKITSTSWLISGTGLT